MLVLVWTEKSYSMKRSTHTVCAKAACVQLINGLEPRSVDMVYLHKLIFKFDYQIKIFLRKILISSYFIFDFRHKNTFLNKSRCFLWEGFCNVKKKNDWVKYFDRHHIVGIISSVSWTYHCLEFIFLTQKKLTYDFPKDLNLCVRDKFDWPKNFSSLRRIMAVICLVTVLSARLFS